ncbi:RNA-binding KH domain-containing protein RCF3 [Bienertia sinuspersici]
MSHSQYNNHTISDPKIEFRILCSTAIAGGIIGHSGSVIKRLERQTTAKIHFDDVVSSASKERLAHVIGSATVNRKLRLSQTDEVAVSAAQEALIRVFDRMLEVGPLELVRCRLLVGPGAVGAVMGKGGSRINKVIQETGGYIKVYNSSNLLPPSAQSSDELIQISGGSLAVKKALVAVTRYIQQKASPIIEGAKKATTALCSSMKLDAANNERAVAEVVFKLLCPCIAVGAVLGFRGRRVKALEEETGAFIQVSAPEAGYKERVITVKAFEIRKSDHSPAQDALVRVFNELMASGEVENLSARLLIHPSQSDCNIVSGNSIISSIAKATGATLRILEQSCTHAGASIDDRVIQIDGEYPRVQVALFQVSWILRESAFDNMIANDNLPRLPHKLFNLPPNLNNTAVLTEKLKSCKVTDKANGSLPSKGRDVEFSSGYCLSTSIEHPRDSTIDKGGSEHNSNNKSVIVANTKVEIAVRADVFSSIFGDDGSNLSRLRMISGAKVEVQDHCSGSEKKIIMSGTPDQTLAAQSLLQAFIIAAH